MQYFFDSIPVGVFRCPGGRETGKQGVYGRTRLVAEQSLIRQVWASLRRWQRNVQHISLFGNIYNVKMNLGSLPDTLYGTIKMEN